MTSPPPPRNPFIWSISAPPATRNILNTNQIKYWTQWVSQAKANTSRQQPILKINQSNAARMPTADVQAKGSFHRHRLSPKLLKRAQDVRNCSLISREKLASVRESSSNKPDEVHLSTVLP